MAGFDRVGQTKGGLDVLAIAPEAFPRAVPPQGVPAR